MDREPGPRSKFSVELERRRLKQGYSSIRKAAQAVGISDTAWGQWERGYRLDNGVASPLPGPGRPVNKEFIAKAARLLDWKLEDALKAGGHKLSDPAIKRFISETRQGWDLPEGVGWETIDAMVRAIPTAEGREQYVKDVYWRLAEDGKLAHIPAGAIPDQGTKKAQRSRNGD